MGRAGIVMGLEVSRLARNNTDWHRLLEICALGDTLILDEEGVYNPKDFNDRLLLGLKGTMSEAELHAIKARLVGGQINKAKRGDLKISLPTGFVYNEKGEVILDPDKQVQEMIRFLFKTFRRVKSGHGVVKVFRENGLKFPMRLKQGFNKGELVWKKLDEHQTRQILRNPRYAGAFSYGKSRAYKNIEGKYSIKNLPREEWMVLIKDSHPGYISWEEYEKNVQQLKENAKAHGKESRKCPPREGPALLQGIAVCGKCGKKMTVRYHVRKEGIFPNYVCQREAVQKAEKVCQDIAGFGIEEAISQILLEVVNPVTLEVALSVQKEIQSRLEEVRKLRKQKVEKSKYEADIARRRFMQVDPDNRLVVNVLEAEWNEKLRALESAKKEYELQCKTDQMMFDEEKKKKILALASDFPKLWKDPRTPSREKKRMVRLILEDVTLIKEEKNITVHIRFKGGAAKSLVLRVPMMIWEKNRTKPEIVREVDALLEDHTYETIAQILNERYPDPEKVYTGRKIALIRRNYGLKRRYDRLREKGLLTQKEISKILGTNEITVRIWRDQGFLKAHPYNDKNECLYEDPGENPPEKMQGVKFSKRKK